MPAQISSHVKGIRIKGDPNGLISARQLRQLLGVPITPLTDHSYIVPLQFAYIVVEHFPPNEAEWDQSLLDKAVQQSQGRSDQIQARLEVAHAIENAYTDLNDYPLLSRLDPHQAEAVAAITVPSLRGIAIFDEQGTGKTVMALCSFDRLRQQDRVDRLLVVAPKSVLGSWQNDAGMLFGDHYRLLTVGGTAKQRRSQILDEHDILVISYETATIEQSLLTAVLAAQTNRYMLVVDESYYVKNADARRTQTVTDLRSHCVRALILCGTPAPNTPHDIIQQINIADEGVTFGQRAIPDDRRMARLTIEDALDDAIYLRRLKHQVFPGIPDKHIERLAFELQPIQRHLYDDIREGLIAQVRSFNDRDFTRNLASFLAKRATLLQICSHPGGIDPGYSEVPAKLLVLDRLLHELIDNQGKKVVLWSYFRYSLQALTERYERYGVSRIDGTVVAVDTRRAAIHNFQHNPDVRLFIGNAAAAGAGITLTAAHHAIYESFSNQAAHYMQSVDRIHRRGQEHDVTYHVLLSHNTLEENEFDRIVSKERASRELLGDVYDEPMTRERFLADLEQRN